MAKVKTVKGSVSADILNESANNFLVRFRGGKISSVPKNHVSEFSSVDEGVLDAIRGGVRRIGDTIKKGFGLFIKSFKQNGFIFFRNEETGEVLQTSHPVNAMIAAKTIEGVGFYPSENMVEAIKLLGEKPIVIEEDEELDEAFDPEEHPLIDLSANDKDEHDPENQPYADVNRETLMKMIRRRLSRAQAGNKIRSAIVVWGAPGIGKSAVLDQILEEKKKDNNFSVIPLNAQTMDRTDFMLPGYEKGENGDDAATDYIKSWIPHFNPRSKYWKYENEIANGTVFKEGTNRENAYDDNGEIDESLIEVKGEGGVFFIDELSRVNEDVVSSLMPLLSDGFVGMKGDRIGTKWIIVGAANRKSDMGGAEKGYVNIFDIAKHSRLEGVNYVPTFEEWKAWSDAYTKKTGEPKILPEIMDFLGEPEFKDYFFYSMGISPDDEYYGDNRVAKASPRTWEEVSDTLKMMMKEENVKTVDALDYNEVRIECSAILGNKVGNDFAKYMFATARFSKEYIEDIWKTGKNTPAMMKTTYSFLAKTGFDKLLTYAPNNGKPSQDELMNVDKFIFSVAETGIGGKGATIASLQSGYKQLHEIWKNKVQSKLGVDIDAAGTKTATLYVRLANNTQFFETKAEFPKTSVPKNTLFFENSTATLYEYDGNAYKKFFV